MLHAVKKVECIGDYKLKLTFRNKDMKIVDLKNELWGPMFEPLQDIEYFKRVKTDGYTIFWPNETDFCPDLLHKIGKNLEKKSQKTPIRKKERIPSAHTQPKESIAVKSRH